MKKFIAIAALLVSSLAFAAEMVVLEDKVQTYGSFFARVDSNLYIDTASGEGYATVVVTEDLDLRDGRNIPTPPQTVVVYKNSVKIEGLHLVGDKVIYTSNAGEIECGKTGVTRYTHRPTIYFNGNCTVDAWVNGRTWDRTVTMVFRTK
ncbi:MAG: hypothetical protein AB7I27_01710 [Bacteriovoracaceae bacterium]